MIWLIIGLLLFLGTHSVSIVAPAWRERVIAARGPLLWKGIYATISLVGLLLIIYGYGQARLDPVWIWQPPAFLRHVTMLLMLPVFICLLATYLPGRIRARLKHPMLVAVKFWALGHLLVNGTLADLLLFGGFLAWAVAQRIKEKRRQYAPPPSLPPRAANDWIALIGGLALYAAFAFWLHPLLIGVPVMVG